MSYQDQQAMDQSQGERKTKVIGATASVGAKNEQDLLKISTEINQDGLKTSSQNLRTECKVNTKKEAPKGNTFQRRKRTVKGPQEGMGVKIGVKRGLDLDDDVVKTQATKKGKGDVEMTENPENSKLSAGLQSRPCASQ